MSNDKLQRIGRFDLILPSDHMLAVYQEQFHLYGWVLGEVARLVRAKYPDARAIDIGANVGDTAAILCRYSDLPILCIEGHPGFLSYLRRNLVRLPKGIELADCLLGSEAGTVASEALINVGGTAGLSNTGPGKDSMPNLPIRLLGEVLRDHPNFAAPRIIKIDTDGADFEIILSSIDVITNIRPVLYFEYTVAEKKDSLRSSIEAITRLAEAGYSKFFAFDNFGNLMQVVSGNVAERFVDINRYIMSHLFFGRQIYYFDICAFSSSDEDLAEELYRYQCELVDSRARQAGWRL